MMEMLWGRTVAESTDPAVAAAAEVCAGGTLVLWRVICLRGGEGEEGEEGEGSAEGKVHRWLEICPSADYRKGNPSRKKCNPG